MDAKDSLYCEVCRTNMHKNDWAAHINGKKHISMETKRKRKHAALSVSDNNTVPTTNDDNENGTWTSETSDIQLNFISSVSHVPSETLSDSQDTVLKSMPIEDNNTVPTTNDDNGNGTWTSEISDIQLNFISSMSHVPSETLSDSQDTVHKSMPIEGTQSDSTGNFLCEVCKVTVNSKTWEVHANGKKHKFLLDTFNKVISNQMQQPNATNSSSSPPSVFCEACKFSVIQGNWSDHVNSKKHKFHQDIYNKEQTTVFVTGTAKFSQEYLEKIFRKHGEVANVVKQPTFSLVQFKEKSAAEKALHARTFVNGTLLFVHKYIKGYAEKKKAQQLPATPVVEPLSESQIGIPGLPVELPDSRQCPPHQNMFDWHVTSFISQVELERQSYYNLNEVITDVEFELQHLLPGCRVLLFGSCGSNLAFRHSDVDLFLQCVGEPPNNFVRREAKVFYKSPKFTEIYRIPSARVPIIKLRHIPTNFKCDLTCSTKLGVCNSRLIRFLGGLDPRIKPLIMVIKYWAKVYDITGSTLCFTTYALVMLVVFYLQQLDPPLLPPIVMLQQLADHQEFSSGWLSSFCDEESTVHSKCLQRENNITLKDLLAGFFRFYRDFDYQNVICPSLGRPVPAEQFNSADDIPEEMWLYKEKLRSEPDDAKLKFKTNVMIRTQDPLELHWNITKNVADKTYFLFIKACEESSKVMAEKDESSLLDSLFSIDKDLMCLSQPYVTVRIPLNVPAGIELCERYELMTEAVVLVMEQVVKADLELLEPYVLSKVQKVDSSQDVHSMSKAQIAEEDLVYICNGNGNVMAQRQTMKKHLNCLGLSLSEHEKEVCVSNALIVMNPRKRFYFDLQISSQNRSKHLNGLEIILSGKETKSSKKLKKSVMNSFSKEVANFLLHNLKQFVKNAVQFIVDTRHSNPAIDVKQSLKELFDSKMENLPNLNDILNSVTLMEKSPTLGNDKNTLLQQRLLLHGIEKDITEQETQSTSHCLNSNNLEKETITSDNRTLNNVPTVNNLEIQEKEHVLLPKKTMPSAKTEAVIDEFLDSNKPDRLVTLPPDEKVKDQTADKFAEMLNTVLCCETKSSFTIKKNPFLASIEKVKLHELCSEASPRHEEKLSRVPNDNTSNIKNYESNGRKIDLQYEITESKSNDKSCDIDENKEPKAKENVNSKSKSTSPKEIPQIKPKLFHGRRPPVIVEQPSSKQRKPNFNMPQNMHLHRGAYKQRANPRRLPNQHAYNNYRYYEDVDVNYPASTSSFDVPCQSLSSQKRQPKYPSLHRR